MHLRTVPPALIVTQDAAAKANNAALRPVSKGSIVSLESQTFALTTSHASMDFVMVYSATEIIAFALQLANRALKTQTKASVSRQTWRWWEISAHSHTSVPATVSVVCVSNSQISLLLGQF